MHTSYLSSTEFHHILLIMYLSNAPTLVQFQLQQLHGIRHKLDLVRDILIILSYFVVITDR
jgi:hypothetical protein